MIEDLPEIESWPDIGLGIEVELEIDVGIETVCTRARELAGRQAKHAEWEAGPRPDRLLQGLFRAAPRPLLREAPFGEGGAQTSAPGCGLICPE